MKKINVSIEKQDKSVAGPLKGMFSKEHPTVVEESVSPISKLVTPSKPSAKTVMGNVMKYTIDKMEPGYSKNPEVQHLIKAFSLNDMKHYCRKSGLPWMLLQVDSGFRTFDLSNEAQMIRMRNAFIISKHHCVSELIGWDLFKTLAEAISVNSCLMGVSESLSSDSLSSSKESDSSDDKVVEDKIDFDYASKDTRKGENAETQYCPAYSLSMSGVVPVQLERQKGTHAAVKKLNMNVASHSSPVPKSECATPKVSKIGGFSYDRTKAKIAVGTTRTFKIDIVVSSPMLSKDGSKKHVIVVCFFNKSSFKTAGIQAILMVQVKLYPTMVEI